MTQKESWSSTGAIGTAMLFGENEINLRPISASPVDWFTAQNPVASSEDLCFLTDVAPDAVAEHFRQCGVTILHGPTRRNGARGPICSVHVRDPDGNLIEVASYED